MASPGFNPPTAPSSGGTSWSACRPPAEAMFQPTHRSFERWDVEHLAARIEAHMFQPTHRSFERWDVLRESVIPLRFVFQPAHRSFERWDSGPSSAWGCRRGFNPPTAPSSGGTTVIDRPERGERLFQPTHRSFE